MWVFSKIGFFSIVKKGGNAHAPQWQIRARVERDLIELCGAAGIPTSAIETSTTNANDYAFRVRVGQNSLMAVMEALGDSVDYDNFKGKIGGVKRLQNLLPLLHDIWHQMSKFQPWPPYCGGVQRERDLGL